MDSRLCNKCRGISPQELVKERPYVFPTGGETIQRGYKHGSYEDLLQSARICPMCAMILQGLMGGSTRPGRKHDVLLMEETYNRNPVPYNISGMHALVTGAVDMEAHLHVFALPSNNAALSGDIAGRPVPQDPESDESFAQIRSWLNECTKTHSECHSGPLNTRFTHDKYPSRLLDVGPWPNGDTSKCILADRTDAQGEYITLSYCWGNTQQLRTLEENLANHKTGIPLEHMPLTLRHAVIATRKLEVRYLWVDALCIVQDDMADWKQEAAQMGSIYKNAYCTIAAAGVDSSEGGLFLPRMPAEPVVSVHYQPMNNGNGVPRSDVPRIMHIAPIRTDFYTHVQDSVWNSRGWVFQERYLSRRTVIFANGQTFFQCQKHSLSEDGRSLHSQAPRYGTTIFKPDGDDWTWCAVIESYTAMALTCPDDKFFAIEGPTRSFEERTGRTVFAGVCTDSLPLHLVWRSGVGGMTRPILKSGIKRAPSWSWASLDGQVKWESSMIQDVTVCQISLASDVRRSSPDDPKVRDARIRYEGSIVALRRSDRIFGEEYKDTHPLEIGMMLDIDIRTHTSCYALLDDDRECQGWAVFDEGDRIVGPFVAAAVSKNKGLNDMVNSITVLMLKETEKEAAEYVRVGVGLIWIGNTGNVTFRSESLSIV